MRGMTTKSKRKSKRRRKGRRRKGRSSILPCRMHRCSYPYSEIVDCALPLPPFLRRRRRFRHHHRHRRPSPRPRDLHSS